MPEGRPTVFFVVGHGKSGTTLLARLLGSHPEVLCLWEERFIGREWHREDLGEVEANVLPRTLSGVIANGRCPARSRSCQPVYRGATLGGTRVPSRSLLSHPGGAL